jgi:putative Holliday junction resolvase
LTILALDVGDRRIGTAISDPTETISRPLGVVTRRSNEAAYAEISRLIAIHAPRIIVVGLPLSSDDRVGEQSRRTLAFVRFIRRRLATPIVTWDERYSTDEASRRLAESGVRRSRRHQLLDAGAAAVILEEWLDSQAVDRTRTTPRDCSDQLSPPLC